MAKFDLFGNLGKLFNGEIRGVVGDRVVINNKRIIVDGKTITDEAEGVIELRITEGILQHAECGMDLTCGEVRGDVDAGMGVKCGNVGGNVDAGMNVSCGNVGGDAEAGMSLTAKDITGHATAGMTVNANSVGSKRDAFSKG